MPNGCRYPYRFPQNGTYNPPSPLHTSDSEYAHNNKIRYTGVVRHVIWRFKYFVRQARVRRMAKQLETNRLLPPEVCNCQRNSQGILLNTYHATGHKSTQRFIRVVVTSKLRVYEGPSKYRPGIPQNLGSCQQVQHLLSAGFCSSSGCGLPHIAMAPVCTWMTQDRFVKWY